MASARALIERLRPAFLLGIIQALLGLILLTRYRPNPDDAHASVDAIAHGPLGLVRSLHAWLATGLIVLVLLHLAFVWLRAPAPLRQTRPWLARVALAGILLAAFETGTVLAWDQRGWEAYEHLRMGLGLGRSQPQEAPLGAVTLAHVLAVPALLLALALSRSEWRTSLRASWSRWKAEASVAAWPAVLLAVLALAFRPDLGPAPIPGLTLAKPDWPFLWLAPLQDVLGRWGLVVGPLVLLAAALAAPRLARSWDTRARTLALWIVAGILFALTAWAAFG